MDTPFIIFAVAGDERDLGSSSTPPLDTIPSCILFGINRKYSFVRDLEAPVDGRTGTVLCAATRDYAR